MIDVFNKNVAWKWERCPRDVRTGRWAVAYATIAKSGDIYISGATHEALGSPQAYILLYDRERDVIGLKPAQVTDRGAYPATPRGVHGGRRIRGYRMIREFGIYVPGTRRFPRCMKDRDGVLLLDLKDTEEVRRKRG